MNTAGQGLPEALRTPPTLLVVLGDFGRDASIRFCATMARHERRHVQRLLPRGAPFYDEYRRTILSLVGDLHRAKAPHLAPYHDAGVLLDAGILVGFGGLEPAMVEARLGLLALEALRAPVEAGCRRVEVLLPCNTLAPVSWGLARRFATVEGLQSLVAEANSGAAPPPTLLAKVAQQTGEVQVHFPTVPRAVLETVVRRHPGAAVLPLGTLHIVSTYRQEAAELDQPPEVLSLDRSDCPLVLEAIEAAIDGAEQRRARARRGLVQLVERCSRAGQGPVVAVEACTDLDYGVGLESNDIYAAWVIDRIYAPAQARSR